MLWDSWMDPIIFSINENNISAQALLLLSLLLKHFYASFFYLELNYVLDLFQTSCCAEVSDRRIKAFFRRARTSRAERLWNACCTPQRDFSTTSKKKRRSVDVMFLCKLEKSEKNFTVNWGIIIEYIHKHYIK